MKSSLAFETLQIHGGLDNEWMLKSRTVPLFQTSAYIYSNSLEVGDLFSLKKEGHTYTRISNPTTCILEERINLLEGGVGCLVLSSGKAAQMTAINNILQPGENFITSSLIYGGTYSQFTKVFKSIGIECKVAASDQVEEFEKLIDNKTKAIYIEPIANTVLLNVYDIEKFVELAKIYNLPLIIDNTLGGCGYIFKPIEWGINIIVESTTKWICGNGTCIGGAIIDVGNFNWYQKKFPYFYKPSENYRDIIFGRDFKLGNKSKGYIMMAKHVCYRDLGNCISPFNSFLTLLGLETLSLRLDKHNENALKLAKWLSNHPKVAQVNYPGLKNSKYHKLARKYLNHGFGSMLTFSIKGKISDYHTLADNLKLASLVTNIGDCKTLVSLSLPPLHEQLGEVELITNKLSNGSMRVSVGLENIDDLINDFERALTKI